MKMTCPFILWISQSKSRVLCTVLVATFEGHWQLEYTKKRLKRILKGWKPHHMRNNTTN